MLSKYLIIINIKPLFFKNIDIVMINHDKINKTFIKKVFV